jgi:signal transduction histidine kinase
MGRAAGVRARLGERARDRHQAVDVLVAAVLGVAAGVEALIDAHGQPYLLAQAPLTGIVLGGLLLARRKRPLLVMTLFTVVAIASSVLQAWLVRGNAATSNQVVPLFVIMVLSYSLGAFGSGRDLLFGLPQPLLVVAVTDLLEPTGNTVAGALVYFAVALVGVPALAGRLIRARQRSLEALVEQRRQLEMQQAMEARTARATERLQLAERLQANLITAIDVLSSQALTAELEGSAGPPATVTAIESRARALLAHAREVVVSLASADSAPETGSQSPAPTDSGGPSVADLRDAGVRRRSGRTAGNATVAWMAIAGAVVGTGLLLQVRGAPALPVPAPVALIGCLVIAAPLTIAWRWPLVMTAAAWAAAALYSAFVIALGSRFGAIGLAFLPPFAVAYFEGRRRAVAGLAICCVGGLLTFGWAGFGRDYEVVLVLAAWIAGRVLVARSGLVDELRSNNKLLARQHEASLRHAVAQERGRIARDLHDSIGHHLTIIALQAGAARRLWEAEPGKARAALATVARVAAQGSAELRLALGGEKFLASGMPFAAVPLTSITALLDNARAAGLPVDLRADGYQPHLHDDIQLALFRVLQESLTNVLRHAAGSSVQVTLHTTSSQVELVVSNSAGDQSSVWTDGASHGRRGMRERVEECGGSFDYERRADGGFEVRACFPVPERQ